MNVIFLFMVLLHIVRVSVEPEVDLITSVHFTQYQHGRVLLLPLETIFVKKQL